VHDIGDASAGVMNGDQRKCQHHAPGLEGDAKFDDYTRPTLGPESEAMLPHFPAGPGVDCAAMRKHVAGVARRPASV